MRLNFLETQAVHFIGIGGAGMSALAGFLLEEGKKISGSDVSESAVFSELKKRGAEISIGQKLSDIPKDTDLIIYSAAIPVAAPDFFAEIKKSSVLSLSYAEALGEISKSYRTIAVSGTHGKTTTTAMLFKILSDAGLSPSLVLGGLIGHPETGAPTNYVRGRSDLLIVEADDYRRNFLSLSPEILIINNIGEDHLDYYKDIDDIRSAFTELARRLPRGGVVVTDFGDQHASGVVVEAGRRAIDYSSVPFTGKLALPGAHNIANAKAAIAAAAALGISAEAAAASLSGFSGVARRFEFKGQTAKGALVYDDYAHNPDKVRALLSGARELFPRQKIFAVFQPHLFSRTKILFDRFVESLGGADEIILAPIYPAREVFDPSVSSEMLAEALARKWPGKKTAVLSDFQKIAEYLKRVAGEPDVILLTGAGDINKVAESLVKKWNQ